MSNIENDIRRTSLRIDESLATEVERLAEENERSFNNQLLILLRKGIKLVKAEEHMLGNTNPVSIVRSVSARSEDDLLKQYGAPDSKTPKNKEGGARELA